MQFGRSSERLAAGADQLELALEKLESDGGEQVGAPDADAATTAPEPNRGKPAWRPLPEHLPCDVVEHAAPWACPRCGGVLRRPASATHPVHLVTNLLPWNVPVSYDHQNQATSAII